MDFYFNIMDFAEMFALLEAAGYKRKIGRHWDTELGYTWATDYLRAPDGRGINYAEAIQEVAGAPAPLIDLNTIENGADGMGGWTRTVAFDTEGFVSGWVFGWPQGVQIISGQINGARCARLVWFGEKNYDEFYCENPDQAGIDLLPIPRNADGSRRYF